MKVTVQTWKDAYGNIPRDFGGTAQHAGLQWEWLASADIDGASAYWVQPVGGYRDQEHEEELEDASSEVFQAVGQHVAAVVELIVTRMENAAAAALESVKYQSVEIPKYL